MGRVAACLEGTCGERAVIIRGQTANDTMERLLDGPGSVDLSMDGEVWISVEVPIQETLKLRWDRDMRHWECYAPLHAIPGTGHWLSLIVMDD